MTSSEDRNNDLSLTEQFGHFMMSFEQGQPIPEVDSTELRRFHERLVEQAPYLKPGTAIGLSALAPEMSPIEAGPLWLRNVFMSFLANQGVLAEWQHGTQLDDSVFKVAATIPLNGLELDAEAFVARLRAEAGV